MLTTAQLGVNLWLYDIYGTVILIIGQYGYDSQEVLDSRLLYFCLTVVRSLNVV